jgi:hypothetical protein
MADLPKKSEGLIGQVDKLRSGLQDQQANNQDYRDNLERPTLRANITVATSYTTSTSYERFGRQCKINVPPGFEAKIRVKLTLDMNVTSASAGAIRYWTFKLVNSADPATALDIERKTVRLDATGSHYDTVILDATDRPKSKATAQYEVMIIQNTSGNARIRAQEQYWEVTPRKARTGKNEELALSSGPPGAPTNLNATATGASTVSLTWTASADTDSYKLYRGTSSGIYSLVASGITATSYSDTGLSAATLYYYAVKATNDDGDSDYSTEDSVTTNTFEGLLFGTAGFNSATLTTHTEFSVAGNTWTTRTAVTAARYLPGGFTLGGKVYTVGGSPTGSSSMADTNYEYTRSGDSWATKTAIASAKGNTPGSKIGTDKGYYPGGSAGASWLDTNYEYSQSGNSWATKTAVTAAKGLHGVSTIGSDKMYLTHGNNGAVLDTNYEYSQSGNSWATKTVGGTARDGIGQATIGSDLAHAVTGFTGVYVNTHQAYSQSGNSWANKTGITAPARRWVGMGCADSDKAQVIGGTDGTVQSVTHEYSQSGNSWSTKTAGAQRYGPAAVGV